MEGAGFFQRPRGGAFAHAGVCESRAESPAGSAPKQVRYVEENLPPAYRARERGFGRKKVEPERRQQNSQNFCLWAHESVPSSDDGFTIYQTSFMKDQNTEQPFCRRYPKHHLEKCYADKAIAEDEKNLQPSKSC
nr:PREDICTED: testis-expressed sequence 36 protein [Struthio camelus australis]